jgi:hypothetical protein
MPRFAEGNQAAAKGRQFEKMLQRAIVQDKYVRLRNAAERLLDAASDGQPWAIQFLALKLDGPALPKTEAGDGAFSITWSFGPAALDVPRETAAQVIDSPALSTLQADDGPKG